MADPARYRYRYGDGPWHFSNYCSWCLFEDSMIPFNVFLHDACVPLVCLNLFDWRLSLLFAVTDILSRDRSLMVNSLFRVPRDLRPNAATQITLHHSFQSSCCFVSSRPEGWFTRKREPHTLVDRHFSPTKVFIIPPHTSFFYSFRPFKPLLAPS